MSYSDRLNNFNTAISTANEHVKNMAANLNNPELQANPVRFGLDTAGQVIGSAEGLVRLRAGIAGGDAQRGVANAFFNRLGEVQKGNAALSNNVGSSVRQALQNASGRAGQSVASATADSQPGTTTASAQAVVQRAQASTASVDPSDADLAAQDGGISSRIQSFPQSPTNSADEANDLNKGINSKVNSALTGDERDGLNNTIQGSLGDFGKINDMPAGGAKTSATQGFLAGKNNIANDVLARKAGGLSPAQAYDTTGKPIGQQTLSGVTTPQQTLPGQAAQADAGGAAKAGAGASNTAGVAPSTNNATAGINPLSGGGAGAEQDGLDILQIGADSKTDLAPTFQAGLDILTRGRGLGLSAASGPAQGGGNVPVLSTAGNAGGDANTVSLSHHVNTAQAQAANAPGGQAASAPDSTIGGQAGVRQNQAAAAASSADNDAANTGGRAASSNTASSAANGADEASSSTSRGLASALSGEETLDALAPDTGPLAPILEAGSLLATLGTGIASIFESPTKETKPDAPAPQQSVGFSVGANLKGDASGSVGAF
tara:strand:+ start:59 stop:1699 length:1641 start_codon:yes stop_codon:yes gene_type:complete